MMKTTLWHNFGAKTVISLFLSCRYVASCSDSTMKSSIDCKENFKSTNGVIVVKYGGSAITRKSELETLKLSDLRVTAEQIKEILNSKTSTMFMIVHGAGSFGHFQASQFGLRYGGFPESRTRGMALTRQSVLQLNGFVMKEHLDVDLPVVAIPLFPMCRTDHGKLVSPGSMSSIEDILNHKMIPVLHGDVVFDHSNYCSIFSGDRVMLWACQNLIDENKPVRAVFLTDVAGVYDTNPSHPNARLLPSLVVNDDGSVDVPETSTLAHDVTGGMRGKIEVAVEIAKLGIPVYIVQVGTMHAFEALAGLEPAVCTRIALNSPQDS